MQQNVEIQGQLSLANVPASSSPVDVPLLVVGPNGQLNSISMADVQNELYKNPCVDAIVGSSPTYPPPVWSNHGGNNPTLYTGVGCHQGCHRHRQPSAQLHVVGNAKVSLGRKWVCQ